jgi:hypothetical protein
MKSFTIVHHDGAIVVSIDDDGHAVIDVQNINDHKIVVTALARAFRSGARRGTLLTGDIVNDQLAKMHQMRVDNGITWLDGTVTRLPDGKDGPRFQIDWERFPEISE